MSNEIKIILKKNCKNSEHEKVGTRLYSGEKICLDCKFDNEQKAYVKHLKECGM